MIGMSMMRAREASRMRRISSEGQDRSQQERKGRGEEGKEIRCYVLLHGTIEGNHTVFV